MVSGRGLGITGGTLDKMESIPGYRTDLSSAEFLDVLDRCGCSIIGQTAELAPADKKLYALRDVTGTVPSIPLITASIMSKKLAEGADALVLDVKWGRGAFMKTVENARELARTLVEVGRRMDKGMRAVVSDMNQPLGRAVGNAVEVVESVDTLRGNGPPDLLDVTLTLGAHMLILGGLETDEPAARRSLERAIESGAAFKKFREMVGLHGGSREALDDPSGLPGSEMHLDYPAPEGGYVAAVDAERIGRASIVLGAGRRRVEDPVDHAVGITNLVKVGERVEAEQPLLTMHANQWVRLEEAGSLLHEAFRFSPDAPSPAPLIVETI
jgi:pyrimidine-nucleoside phosphorylase